ncbi:MULTISPECIES: DUF2726 domain-containing protein [unclassified Pseudoalteromonas]|uniref:DUF2726 domain-containing protein n=1 Tax=unclassified Pseudoalteromonas TaxID=194690 RepID=UPI000CF724A7|nr:MULTISPECIES: DUF2726 domain-containing protein [unclassified Pseudoalteromonas]MBS3799038.1 DUF2726 domain-containing protein [Pseudoalteromonas sp. BDTF-M6]
MEFALLSILVLVVIASVMASKFTDNNENPYPFVRKKEIYTQVESAFLTLLERAVGDNYRIVSRVKLADIIDCKSGLTNKSKRIALTKLKNKQLDYVLLDKTKLTIVAAVDLVNNANKGGHKAQRDWFVSGALETAGIPHIRMKVKSGYRPEDVRNAILFKIGKNETSNTRKSANPPVLSPSQAKLQMQTPAINTSTQLAEI